MTRPAPEIVTFGCRLNIYESEVMRGHAEAAGLHNAVLVNTCAVTGEAERQARQAIRKLARTHPSRPIVVTGCAAQLNPTAFRALPGVTAVLGNEAKLDPASYTHLAQGSMPGDGVLTSDIMAVRETAAHMVDGFAEKVRAFVQIQQGCDHRCTFCIIPFARGNNRSVPLGVLVEQVRTLVAQGHREVVLTGVDITGWGSDLPGAPTLGQLVKRLLAQVPALPRLRLSSLDPVEIDETLVSLFGTEPRLLPHVHLSIQAGADLILKRMKRRHLRAHVLEVVARLRAVRSDMAFGADVIAGFPTETEEHFAESLDLVRACDLTHLHVFPYSPRPGTPAARMPQVPGPMIKDRAARLRAAGEAQRSTRLDREAGTTTDVLVEKPGFGHSASYLPVALDEAIPVGSIVPVRLSRTANGLHGTIVDQRAA